MKYYALFGERNSGTKYLRTKIGQLNLKQREDFGFKHYSIPSIETPNRVLNKNIDLNNNKDLYKEDTSNILFLHIVRNPYDWIMSMYHKPHDIYYNESGELFNESFVAKYIKEMGFGQFIRRSFISCIEIPYRPPHSMYNAKCTEETWIEDTENIIKLRNYKNDHFLKLKDIVENYELILQENLIQDLNRITKKYGIGKVDFQDYREPKNYEKDLITLKDYIFIENGLDNIIDNTFYKHRKCPKHLHIDMH